MCLRTYEGRWERERQFYWIYIDLVDDCVVSFTGDDSSIVWFITFLQDIFAFMLVSRDYLRPLFKLLKALLTFKVVFTLSKYELPVS